MVTLSVRTVSDHVALAEIELCGELMIAASAAIGERLSADRIDEVLDVRETTVPGRATTGGERGPAPEDPRHQVRSSRAIAFVASSTLASISSPPLTAASATQCRRCSSRSWRAKDWSAFVDAETWVSMSMQ